MKKIRKIAALSLAVGLMVAPFSTKASAAELTPDQVKQAYETRTSLAVEIPSSGTSAESKTTHTKRYVYNRGSTMAWSTGTVNWTYNGTSIKASSGSQDAGYIFPDIVRKLGIKKIATSTSKEHIYLHKTSVSIGTNTPWGDVTFVTSDCSDYLHVTSNGRHYRN